MTQEATPEQLTMARRVINENSDYMRGLDRGQCNFSAKEVMQIALAAIIETQRLDANLAWKMAGKQMPAYAVGEALRAGKHYGKDESNG